MRYEPLRRFPAVRTQDVGELRQRMSGLFSVLSMDLGRDAHRTFEGHLNHRQLKDVGLTYIRYGAALAACVSHGDSFLQGFPLRGHGSYVLDGAEGGVSRSHGVSCGPRADLRVKYSSDFEHLILRINPQRLVRTLSGLIGEPLGPAIRMTTTVESVPEETAAQRRLLEFVVGELDQTDSPLPRLVLDELERALIVSFLRCNRHNYSHLLEGSVRPVASWQVRFAQEYIEQNWDQPLTVEALALATQTSVRSLFDSFKKSRGISPMHFVRQVRLRHAKQMLMSGRPETTVTSVALDCGFSNLGHFARHYHAAFGEQPSATLRAARG